MIHLRILSIVHKVDAAICLLLCFMLAALTFSSFMQTNPHFPSWGWVILALCSVFGGALKWRIGQKVLEGQWRTCLLVLAALNLPFIPLGMIYGFYVFWVCLFNEESKKIFESAEGYERSCDPIRGTSPGCPAHI